MQRLKLVFLMSCRADHERPLLNRYVPERNPTSHEVWAASAHIDTVEVGTCEFFIGDGAEPLVSVSARFCPVEGGEELFNSRVLQRLLNIFIFLQRFFRKKCHPILAVNNRCVIHTFNSFHLHKRS